MAVDTLSGEGVAEDEELTINYSPGHSNHEPRYQHPPFYFGVFYGEQPTEQPLRGITSPQVGGIACRRLHGV